MPSWRTWRTRFDTQSTRSLGARPARESASGIGGGRIYRSVAERTVPEILLPQLADALNTLSVCFDALGSHQQALTAREEHDAIVRRLAE